MLWQNVRYGTRMLGHSPGFALVVILILGLGLGATTAVFSIVNGVLWHALPYKDPDRLMMVFSSYPQWNMQRSITSGLNYLDWRQQSQSFEDLAVLRREGTTYRHAEGTDHVEGLCVSPNFFSLLGWEALVGRTFLPEETWPNHGYVVLGYDFWQRRLGGDEAILGKGIQLGGGSGAFTVVGIMPPGLRFLDAKAKTFVDFWIPVDRDLPEIPLGGRGCMRWSVVGRLKQGVTVRQAQTEMEGIAERIARTEYSNPADAPGVNVVPLHEYVVGDIRSLLLLAGGGAGFVLLVACANVANLLLARNLARRREMATRATLGAGRLQLLCQALTESVLLSLLGGAVGIMLANGGVAVFRAMAPSDMPRLEEVSVESGTLVFALGAVLLTGIVVGLVPAWRTCRPDLSAALKADARGATLDFGRRRLASLFVASQVSLSLILLVGAGLLVNSLTRLLRLDPGYRTDNLLTVQLENMRGDSPDVLLERARSLPGVHSAALVQGMPLGNDGPGGSDILPEGRQESELGQHMVAGRIVSPGYFRAMGIGLLAGRDFTENDAKGSPAVTVINESLARRFWSGEDPIGKKFKFGWADMDPEIIGVVRDIKSAALDADPVLEAFLCSHQVGTSRFTLVIATQSNPTSLVGSLRQEIRASHADAVIRDVRTMADIVGRTLATRRLLAVVLSVFSLVAVVLASFGIYGVIAHSVRQRTPEIGIRMALGATNRDVLQAVLKEGLRLTIVGVVVGLAGALILTRVISKFLYGVTATDPMTFVCTSLLLAGVALLASYLPARRAARIDPMVALRHE